MHNRSAINVSKRNVHLFPRCNPKIIQLVALEDVNVHWEEALHDHLRIMNEYEWSHELSALDSRQRYEVIQRLRTWMCTPKGLEGRVKLDAFDSGEFRNFKPKIRQSGCHTVVKEGREAEGALEVSKAVVIILGASTWRARYKPELNADWCCGQRGRLRVEVAQILKLYPKTALFVTLEDLDAYCNGQKEQRVGVFDSGGKEAIHRRDEALEGMDACEWGFDARN
ncbi:hypothetical protein FB45DRAFT_873271 [Roridomyces roridus]|uniref:Uncharacterized protein n=1 Tax=Roridomyces roridus TaxID=1738132 RepID=A0AAD7BB30_9AGAR|nr:hypothetical protein FB45DRAFT_873271 [Roridomyces roridus]